MRFLLRASVTCVLLVVLAGCGVTGDKVDQADDTTSSTSSTTEPKTTTTTTEPESTTTSDDEDNGLDEKDPELTELLLTVDDFDAELEVSTDSDPGFDEEFCEGHDYNVLPVKQTSVDFQSPDESTFVTEGIAEFDSEDEASQFLADLEPLNEACLVDDADDAVAGTFEPIEELGDEAVRVNPDPSSDPFEIIVVRADERIILLASAGEEQLLSNAVIIEAVDRAAP